MPRDDDRQRDRQVERVLEGALAGPAADPEFRARLRQQLLAAHPAVHHATEPDRANQNQGRAQKMRHSTQKARRPWGRIAMTLTAVALVAAVGLTYVLHGGPETPLAEFGALPAPGAGLAPALSGAGGPGFTFALTYELSGQLDQIAPGLPSQAAAYRRLPLRFDESYVAAVAAQLGITAPVEREGWQDGYLLVADPGELRPALRMYPSGYIVFSQQHYEYRPLTRAELPEDIRAIAAAREWLVSSGMVDAGELGQGSVTADLDIGVLFIRFTPLQPADTVTLAPWAQVEMGVGEVVITGSAVWFGGDEDSPYPLRSVEQAWQDVQVGRAALSWQTTEYQGPADDEGVVRGTVTVTSVRLAWALALAADGAPYLVPVYSFSGIGEVAGEEGPVQLPLQAWTGAVSGAHQAP